MDSHSDHSKLDCLPVELLRIIVLFISERGSLKSLSRVNRLLQQLCVPFLFQTLQVGFSIPELDRLLRVAKSQFAPYVRAINYWASALVDPFAGSWETFHTCLYPQVEFARDRIDPNGMRNDGRFTYRSLFSYFHQRCREQQDILETEQDTRTLIASLPCFANLHTIQLLFADGIEDRFQWLANWMLLDGHPLFPNHLERLLTAVVVARENDVTIRTFEIRGFYSRAVTKDRFLQQLAGEALSSVEELRLVDSPAMLAFVNQVPFPCLRRVELTNCWLSIPTLEEFTRLHSGGLESIHLENTWVLEETVDADGIHMSMGCTKSILDQLTRIPGAGHLRLTINRLPEGGYEAQIKGNFPEH
ncbi:hypothetical protein BJX63DRAFT_426550 [Aspergillus granulosus]|uniref:F-box domain-containing protein n=1 Tax=Aspergillus granulosus TaxID=176169 RepID=A0ABR4GT56_9EURO